jgi:hypothetical protein
MLYIFIYLLLLSCIIVGIVKMINEHRAKRRD